MITTRVETAADIGNIADVTRLAFANLAISQQNEHFIIQELRATDELAVSLVAECAGHIVGHVAFSRVMIHGAQIATSDDRPRWYGLGPLSVLPEMQRQGVGKELVRQGLSQLQMLGAEGCCLAGDPRYYERFGFRSMPVLRCEGVPPPYFLALPLGTVVPEGTVEFHPAFWSTS